MSGGSDFPESVEGPFHGPHYLQGTQTLRLTAGPARRPPAGGRGRPTRPVSFWSWGGGCDSHESPAPRSTFTYTRTSGTEMGPLSPQPGVAPSLPPPCADRGRPHPTRPPFVTEGCPPPAPPGSDAAGSRNQGAVGANSAVLPGRVTRRSGEDWGRAAGRPWRPRRTEGADDAFPLTSRPPRKRRDGSALRPSPVPGQHRGRLLSPSSRYGVLRGCRVMPWLAFRVRGRGLGRSPPP